MEVCISCVPWAIRLASLSTSSVMTLNSASAIRAVSIRIRVPMTVMEWASFFRNNVRVGIFFRSSISFVRLSRVLMVMLPLTSISL
ncbi:hypothetical protein MBAV_001756 [Candidatus Magnetobacterium bavaricum]|uniref:Uncharacterized protein n=1 Tax=Candidatus Magnetobacterium bavaricum TaxID=29290 RepID=A0A0F3GVY4_9BACT|nr:hypothetical protein MBAV_001756 [Candidatus Magnetobacterium bavaricum]